MPSTPMERHGYNADFGLGESYCCDKDPEDPIHFGFGLGEAFGDRTPSLGHDPLRDHLTDTCAPATCGYCRKRRRQTPMGRAAESLLGSLLDEDFSEDTVVDYAESYAHAVVSALLSDEEAMVEVVVEFRCLLADTPGAPADGSCQYEGAAKHPECAVAALVAHLLGEPTND